MKAIRHVIRGCGYLEHCGHHPGTAFLAICILMGAYAGAIRGGWSGALGGAAFMGVFIGPLYLRGAYDRSVLDDRLTASIQDLKGDDNP